jgi:hypothetical protein
VHSAVIFNSYSQFFRARTSKLRCALNSGSILLIFGPVKMVRKTIKMVRTTKLELSTEQRIWLCSQYYGRAKLTEDLLRVLQSGLRLNLKLMFQQ